MIKFYLYFHFGGLGVISVLSNIIPKDVHNMVQFFFDGKIKESIDLQLNTLNLTAALFCEVNPMPVKEAVNLLGYNAGIPRLPLIKISDVGKEKLIKEMMAYGILKS